MFRQLFGPNIFHYAPNAVQLMPMPCRDLHSGPSSLRHGRSICDPPTNCMTNAPMATLNKPIVRSVLASSDAPCIFAHSVFSRPAVVLGRSALPEVNSTRREAALRSSRALTPSVGYGSCGLREGHQHVGGVREGSGRGLL